MDPFTALYLALEETPGDELALLALADCYLEEGQVDASMCVRWSLARGRHPFRYTNGALSIASGVMTHGHWWWAIDDRGVIAGNWGYPHACRLPRGMWDQLPHSFSYTPSVFKQYPTIRDAYEALIYAWPLSPAFARAMALRGRRP
jgi:hypothetical protein